MRNVMKSQSAHALSQSCLAGTPKGDAEYGFLGTNSPLPLHAKGDRGSGKRNGGRSKSHSEYRELLSTQRWTGRRFASVKSVKVSVSEN